MYMKIAPMGRLRISAWFVIVVGLAGVVFLLEYAVLFQTEAQVVSLPGLAGQVRGTDNRQDTPPHGAQAAITAAAAESARQLAVVVPAHAGDLDKALASLAKWPKMCHESTLNNADLVLYYAGGPEGNVDALIAGLAETGGRCFASTKLVLGNLTKKENVYPKGPSVQFYKMFLDENVSKEFQKYDAIALIEWDVIVAHETSFPKLYQAAFGNVEPFWVKGSTLDGVNFHETVVLPESRSILGHINGNAIYNNTDPAFVEFVSFTLTRWEYLYPYDVALWTTIADFPYSWPLWQRYSRKFVATDLIANVGFLDLDEPRVKMAVASDTLFIHGSLSGGGGSMYASKLSATDNSPAQKLKGQSDQCTFACGSSGPMLLIAGAYTVCDRSCDAGDGTFAARFDGYLCGAGDSELYGEHCRTCYHDLAEAQAAEQEVMERNLKRGGGALGGHGEGGVIGNSRVIMCDTMMPPPPLSCSNKCQMKIDTVCDETCGSGRYNDYNCNWRGYGSACRFCFNDRNAALHANEVANRRSGSVIMCHTLEPPTEQDDFPVLLKEKYNAEDPSEDEVDQDQGQAVSSDTEMDIDDDFDRPPSMLPFVNDIVRGELCAFFVSYSSFIRETEVAVKSIHQFMPGMRIAIATHPNDYSVHERTLGSLPDVKISMAEPPLALAPLLADRHCGEGTRLIYYMNLGELLSRKFTSKDTHSVSGDLLVAYAEISRVGQASVDRALATTKVLGFSSPSFSFGMDIMLPAETNQQLRDVLLSDGEAKRKRGRASLSEDTRALHTIGAFEGVFVPEILAALAYSRNPPGLWFINPQQWVTHHMFQRASIWDIPLVKPRFGCAFDISVAPQGFNVAAELEAYLRHFISGGSCDRGFIPMRINELMPKSNIEFGFPTDREMPSLESMGVSVVFHVPGDVDVGLLATSLSSVVTMFPDVMEAVIVFLDLPTKGTMKLVKKRIKILMTSLARLPIEIVARRNGNRPIRIDLPEDSQSGAGGGIGYWSSLHADAYCKGDFVMLMEAGDLLVKEVTYDNIFHFGKPVLPFTRLSDEFEEGPGMAGPMKDCIAETMTFAIGKPVVHDFALLRGLVHPRRAYTLLREMVQKVHSADIETLVANGRTSCGGVESAPVISRFMYDASILGSFLWHNMHGSVHWRALHPLDIEPDEWESDVDKYDLLCNMGPFAPPPENREAHDGFLNALAKIDSRESCDALQEEADFW